MLDVKNCRALISSRIEDIEDRIIKAKKHLAALERSLFDERGELGRLDTSYVMVGEVVFEYFNCADHYAVSESVCLHNDNSGEFFYSMVDKGIHEVCGWHTNYFYDEHKNAHRDTDVHKVVASSDKVKYPSLNELTVKDLANTQYKK